jgi:hypothetical protein
VSQLAKDWDEFTRCDRLIRVGASVGALTWMDYPYLRGSRASDRDGHFEPIALPIQWSRADAPPGVDPWLVDPLVRDGSFWIAEQTFVRDCTGRYRLTPDGNLTPVWSDGHPRGNGSKYGRSTSWPQVRLTQLAHC